MSTVSPHSLIPVVNNNGSHGKLLEQIGITKVIASDFIYFKIREDTKTYADSIFSYPNHYKMHPFMYDGWNRRPRQTPKPIDKYLSKQQWQTVFDKVKSIQKEANDRRRELCRILKKNRNLYASSYWTSSVVAPYERFVTNPANQRNVSGIILFILTIHLTMVLGFLIAFFALLYDLAFCMYCRRWKTKEMQWYVDMMDQNPSLDTEVIDADVLAKLTALKDEMQLMISNREVIVEIHKEVVKRFATHGDTVTSWMEDEFAIRLYASSTVTNV